MIVYDVFFIGSNSAQLEQLRKKVPTAKKANSIFEAQQKSLTSMFWCVYGDYVEVVPEFEFNFEVPKWDCKYVHVFKHYNRSKQTFEFENAVILLSKTYQLDQTANYLTDAFAHKKQIDTVASSTLRYDKFVVSSYDDYVEACKNASTEYIWLIPSDVKVLDTFEFDYQVAHWDKDYIHVFNNIGSDDVVILVHKDNKITQREFNYQTYAKTKKIDITASEFKGYDVVFISYREKHADYNFDNLKKKCPSAKRVHGVTGIHQAHIQAANNASTSMFWVVDGDAEILDNFEFDYDVPIRERDVVHVWRSLNPINDLSYGYGGVKLLPTEMTKQLDLNTTDMTTSISKKFKAVSQVSNVTAFNTSQFETWKSAFRECAKLASKTIDRQKDNETDKRLRDWCTLGNDKPYGTYAISGAKAGAEFGQKCKDDKDEMKKINDFNWLWRKFNDMG